MIRDRATAVVVLDLGSPAIPEEVLPFVRAFLRDRRAHPLPFWKEPVRALRAQMRGDELGRAWEADLTSVTIDSPLQRVSLAQAHGAAERLGCEGYAAVLLGRPGIRETQELMIAEGIERVVPIVLDPLSPDGGEPILAAFRESWRELTGRDAGPEVSCVLAASAAYMEVLSLHLRETLQLIRKPETPLLFIARDPGRAVMTREFEDRARQQMTALAARLELGDRGRLAWLPPRTDEAGAGPHPAEVLRELAEEGHEQVALVPLGWVADRFETLYDIDLDLTRVARAEGMRTFRVPTLNDRPEFLDALAAMIDEAVNGEPRKA